MGCENSASKQDPTVQSDRRSDQKKPEEPSTWCPCQVVCCIPAQKSYWVWQVWRYVEGPEGEAREPDQEGDGSGLYARGSDRQIHLPVQHEPEGADQVPGVGHILNVRRLLDEGAGLRGMECRKGGLRQQLLELHPMGWTGRSAAICFLGKGNRSEVRSLEAPKSWEQDRGSPQDGFFHQVLQRARLHQQQRILHPLKEGCLRDRFRDDIHHRPARIWKGREVRIGEGSK